MKVRELIEKLKEFPENMTVSVAKYDFAGSHEYVDELKVGIIEVWIESIGTNPPVHGSIERCPYGYEAIKKFVEERLLISCWDRRLIIDKEMN